ncbi:MAG: molybdenum cofactor guanylyltransferase [Acidobacteria bacterium]|nr:MAG: molybdenum cofactor guanylyltransferase [Acidobacteriota bacterium]
MMCRVDNLTAFILAGGKSSRMGADKAFLELKGRTLLERALETVRVFTPEAIIVGERAKFVSFGTVVEDIFRDRGPLGGIHAALSATATDLNLILAVDLPFLETTFLKYLLRQAAASDALVTLPRAGGGWQPLCAVYRKTFAAIAERSLLQGRNKIDPLFADIKTLVLEERELARRGFSPDLFRNVNTPEELNDAKRQRANKK